jgi:hypothetical protein
MNMACLVLLACAQVGGGAASDSGSSTFDRSSSGRISDSGLKGASDDWDHHPLNDNPFAGLTAGEFRQALKETLAEIPRSLSFEPTYEQGVRLVDLYEAVRDDTRLRSPERDRFERLIRGRLESVSKAITRRLVKNEERRRQRARRDQQADDDRLAGDRIDGLDGRGDVLGQFGGGGQAPGGQGGQGGFGQGGFGGFGGGNGVGGFNLVDYGPQLVELIQRTIRPDVWDVNGGEGSIVYFRPLRVLVVTAPGEVHGQLGGLLNGFRQ